MAGIPDYEGNRYLTIESLRRKSLPVIAEKAVFPAKAGIQSLVASGPRFDGDTAHFSVFYVRS